MDFTPLLGNECFSGNNCFCLNIPSLRNGYIKAHLPVNNTGNYLLDIAFSLMATETNRYSTKQFLSPDPNLPPDSTFKTWKQTDRNDMKAFVALQLAMGLWQKNELEDFWEAWWLTHTCTKFTKAMFRNWFKLIFIFIFCWQWSQQVSKGRKWIWFPVENPSINGHLWECLHDSVHAIREIVHWQKYDPLQKQSIYAAATTQQTKQMGDQASSLSEGSSGYALKSKHWHIVERDQLSREENPLLQSWLFSIFWMATITRGNLSSLIISIHLLHCLE